MPKKANPPRGQVAREPEIINLLELPYCNPRSGDGKPPTFLRADIQDCGDCLTEKQREILRAIAYFFHLNSYGISQRELMAATSTPGSKTLQAEVLALKKAGYCKWLPGEERTLHLIS